MSIFASTFLNKKKPNKSLEMKKVFFFVAAVAMMMSVTTAKAQFVDKVQTVTVRDVTFRMQPVEGGEFMMGIDGGQKDCGPAHRTAGQ